MKRRQTQSYTRRQVLGAAVGTRPLAFDPQTDLALHIQATPLADTHEHQPREDEYLKDPPDLLKELFGNYMASDLVAAGLPMRDASRLTNVKDPDIEGRFKAAQRAIEACKYTGYGQGTRWLAKELYGVEEFTPASMRAAHEKLSGRDRRGERLRLLRDVANLHHIQTADFRMDCRPDPTGPDFFYYDLTWFEFTTGAIDPKALAEMTGVTVTGLANLRRAAEIIFERSAPRAIAVKTYHAYFRTLAWSERSDAEVERVLQKLLKGQQLDPAEALALGDWGSGVRSRAGDPAQPAFQDSHRLHEQQQLYGVEPVGPGSALPASAQISQSPVRDVSHGLWAPTRTGGPGQALFERVGGYVLGLGARPLRRAGFHPADDPLRARQ